MGTVQSEQIPSGIVLTALFPYVIRFSMELFFYGRALLGAINRLTASH